MALAIDVNIHANKSGTGNPLSVTSASFSTAQANEPIFVFVGTGPQGTSTGWVINSVTMSSGAVTFSLIKRSNTSKGTAEIWGGYATSALSSVTITATGEGNTGDGIGMAIISFTGSGPDLPSSFGATAAASGAAGTAPSGSLNTTAGDSWVWGCGFDWDSGTARTVGANQTLVYEDVDATSGITFWTQRQNSTTPTSGTNVTINDTLPTTDQWNLSLVEILPASGGSGGSTNHFLPLLGCGA